MGLWRSAVGMMVGMMLWGEAMAVKPIPEIPTFGGFLYVGPDGALTASNSAGLVRTENDGETWTILKAENGLLLGQADRLLLITDTKVLGSRDGGQSWQTEGPLADVPWSNRLFQWPRTLDERGWLYFCQDDVLRFTPDGGVSWHEIRPPKGCRKVRASENSIYVLAAGHVQLSRDGGKTWRLTAGKDDAARQVIDSADDLFVMAGSHARLLAYKFGGQMFLSENGGKNWRPHGIGASPEEKTSILEAVLGYRDVVFFHYHQDEQVVYRSSDGINKMRLGLSFDSSLWRLVGGRDGTLYVVDLSYVYKSVDDGKTWKRLGRGGIMPRGYEKLPSLLPHD